jgi:hypothetical protein
MDTAFTLIRLPHVRLKGVVAHILPNPSKMKTLQALILLQIEEEGYYYDGPFYLLANSFLTSNLTVLCLSPLSATIIATIADSLSYLSITDFDIKILT